MVVMLVSTVLPGHTGWAWPGNSRKAHYFEDSTMSACKNWMFSGPIEDREPVPPRACAACYRWVCQRADGKHVPPGEVIT
jgi:hypothetical protein